MYLSAERMAVANQAVQETFEQTSVAWQAIPHWETGDPGQSKVRSDVIYPQPGAKLGAPLSGSPLGGPALDITVETVPFYVTLAQASAPTPDALLAALMSRTAELAGKFDDKVIGDLCGIAKPKEIAPPIAAILGALIDARSSVENVGYRAPSCLFASTGAVKAISALVEGLPVTESLFGAAHINSLQRVPQLDPAKPLMFLLGRRQRIAHSSAAEASPGEEPVDIAVSVPPSLEVVGETVDGNIELAVRVRFAPRIKDVRGVVAVVGP
jgi:hypothetical protein